MARSDLKYHSNRNIRGEGGGSKVGGTVAILFGRGQTHHLFSKKFAGKGGKGIAKFILV